MAYAKYFVNFLIIQVVLQLSVSSLSDKFFCGDYEFFEDMESFYKIHTSSKTWDDARKRCMLEGASLWYPRDDYEADAILCYLNETHPEFDAIHVGISSKLTKGAFRTIDGTSLTYIYNKWNQGEPNDAGGNEDCGTLRKQGKYSYNDVPCTTELPFICKKTLASLQWDDKCNVPYLVPYSIPDSSPSTKFFRGDYKYFEDRESFYKIHTLSKMWDDARDRCMWEGASLWYPKDNHEVDTVLLYLNETAPTFDSIYVGISSRLTKGVFETIDGTPLTNIYNEWNQGEPSNSGGNEDCVALRKQGTYSYNDVPCTVKLPFICKKTLASLHWDVKCNVPYLGYEYSEELGKCYKLHAKPLRWRDAFAMCDAEESYLAIINSEAEAKYLKNMTEKAPTGTVIETYLQGQIHVGVIYDTTDNAWKTISGASQDVGYPMWKTGQPDGGNNERCGSISINDGKLNDIGCESHKCFFICEREKKFLNHSRRFADNILPVYL